MKPYAEFDTDPFMPPMALINFLGECIETAFKDCIYFLRAYFLEST